jgi:hypothetical protein
MPKRDAEGHPDVPDWSRLPDEVLLNAEVGDLLRRAVGFSGVDKEVVTCAPHTNY